jgi:PAS domain S-box-containing protein
MAKSNSNGQEEKSKALSKDINHSENGKNVIKELEERLIGITEHDQLGAIVASPDRVLYANSGIAKILEMPREEIYKSDLQTLLNLVHPDDRQFVSDQLKKKLNNEKDVVSQYSLRLVTEPNVEKHVRLYSETVTLEGQKAILGTFVDFTEQVKSQLELTRERDFISKVLEIIPTLVCVMGADGRILHFNRHCEKVSGYSSDEIMGRYVWELPFLPEDLRNQKNVSLSGHLKADSSETSVDYWTTRDGQQRLVQWTHTFIRNSQGELEYVIGSGIEITERKLAEQELINHRERLEELVLERTKELHDAQAELINNERLAALGQLTAVVSHELRNPLGTIKTSVYTLSEMLEKEGKIRKIIERIERGVARCDVLIEDLLDFTRARDLYKKHTQLDELLNEIIEDYPFPGEIKIISRIESGMAVMLDSERFRRCIINLIDNACHALNDIRNDREKNLAIECKMAGDSVEIKVIDNGIGIPENEIERIFEPLYSTKNFGAGLGLSIVKQIVNQHNGNIQLESLMGDGTTATISLPVA